MSNSSIKLADGNILTKKILNFDTIQAIFINPSFHSLYRNSLLSSPKLPKSLRDKLDSNKIFTLHYLYTSFLVNVGRLNTTLTFQPQIRSNLRVFYPIPSLRLSHFLLGDSPRIKNVLNGTLDPNCVSLQDVQLRLINGIHPPTPLTNFIFILFNSAQTINRDNLHSGFTLHNLLWPSNIPSHLASNAFLWLVYHYLHKVSDDQSHPNPFDDDWSRQHPGRCPRLVQLSDAELMHENIDLPEDLEWATQMQQQRIHFLTQLNPQSTDHEPSITHENFNSHSLLAIATKDALETPLHNYQDDLANEPTHAISRKLAIINSI
ncbi:hypothetical protein E3P78_01190 [Wallemia ichthyophaga]|nr:hypothetical protein E3P78_01190 [Wallemia ichthyophaga]